MPIRIAPAPSAAAFCATLPAPPSTVRRPCACSTRNRRFLRNPPHLAKHVAIQHDVAKHQHGVGGKQLKMAGQRTLARGGIYRGQGSKQLCEPAVGKERPLIEEGSPAG